MAAPRRVPLPSLNTEKAGNSGKKETGDCIVCNYKWIRTARQRELALCFARFPGEKRPEPGSSIP
jgi:hypothetical protein